MLEKLLCLNKADRKKSLETDFSNQAYLNSTTSK